MDRSDRAEPGKIAQLVSVLASYTPQVEADLQRWYQTDLRDLYRPAGGAGRLTWRRLGVLVEHLPPESATKTAMRDDADHRAITRQASDTSRGYGPWTREALMLAAVCDRLDRLAFYTIKAAGGKPREPKPFPRPGVVDKSQCEPDPRARAFLDRLRRQRRHG